MKRKKVIFEPRRIGGGEEAGVTRRGPAGNGRLAPRRVARDAGSSSRDRTASQSARSELARDNAAAKRRAASAGSAQIWLSKYCAAKLSAAVLCERAHGALHGDGRLLVRRWAVLRWAGSTICARARVIGGAAMAASRSDEMRRRWQSRRAGIGGPPRRASLNFTQSRFDIKRWHQAVWRAMYGGWLRERSRKK